MEELKAQASKSKAEPSSNGEEYRIALLSAPSVYYALPDKLRQRAYFFDVKIFACALCIGITVILFQLSKLLVSLVIFTFK